MKRTSANRYIGAFNSSVVDGLSRDAFGTVYPPKPTVIERLSKGSVVYKQQNKMYDKGDVWDNPDEVVAQKEYKAFHRPKEF